MIIADTSGLLALFNTREPAHQAVTEAVAAHRGPLIVSPFVVAELDYLVTTRLGVEVELTVLRELTSAAYELPAIGAADLDVCVEVVDRYRNLDLGVADASLVVLARRLGTRHLLTLDRRHFSVIRPLDGGRFHLLPT